MIFRRACAVCAAKDAEIAFLREQIAAERGERSKLLDRIMALANPAALAHVGGPQEVCRTFASDETGTTVLHGGEEHDVQLDGDGDPCVVMDGALVKLSELDEWMQRASQEAVGLSPGSM